MDDTVLYNEENNQIRLKWDDPSTGEPFQQTYPLPVTIGRSRKNNLTLNSDRVSRQHAVIEKRGDQFFIRDLESSNGIQVNQERITEQALVDGDLLQIGPFIIEVDVPPFALPAEPSDETVLRWTDPRTGQAAHHSFSPPLTIGRGQENDLILPGERVSRRHAAISRVGDNLVIEDQGATNGVIINGARQEKSILRTGDLIQIGGYKLTFSVLPAKVTPSEEAGSPLDFAPHQPLFLPKRQMTCCRLKKRPLKPPLLFHRPPLKKKLSRLLN